MTDAWLPVEDAERLTGKSARTLRRWAAAGVIDQRLDEAGRTQYRMAGQNVRPSMTGQSARPPKVELPPAPIAEVVTRADQVDEAAQDRAFQMGRKLGQLEQEAAMLRVTAEQQAQQIADLTGQVAQRDQDLAVAAVRFDAERQQLLRRIAELEVTGQQQVTGQKEVTGQNDRPDMTEQPQVNRWRRLLRSLLQR